MKFTFYPTLKNPIAITAKPSSKLYDSIKAAGEKLKKFSFSNSILFAEVNDHHGSVAVLPNFPCKDLKQNGKVQAKPKIGATPTKFASDDADKENKASGKERVIFYVKSNSRGITKIPSSLFEGNLLAVVANPEDTLAEAIADDGRFSEEYILLQDNERQSDVPLHYKVSDHSREVFIMKKRPRKRKATGMLALDKELILSESESINQSVYSSMPATVKEKLTDEIRKTMIEDARKSALKTLVEPGVEEEQLDTKIRNVAQKFGRFASYAVPARVMPMLTEATKSVGFVKCGDCTGSCFLLRKNVIITCQHVINDIYTKRSQSTDKETYKTISIYFNFLHSLDLGTCYGQVDEKKIYASDGKLDYAICCIKRADSDQSTPTTLTELGSFVRCPLPRDGMVILVGHPESNCKRFEVCRILPRYNWHSTLCKRASDAEQYCQQHPKECTNFNNMSDPCVHIWKARALQGDHPDQLPYDTSFFHGSSGSPVFNCDGHIVAMHTQGYPFYQGSKKVSLMEFGVTFGAICRHVKERYGDKIANCLFPEECKDPSQE